MLKDSLGAALREMRESLGDTGTKETIKEMLKDGSIKPEDFSLKEAWDAFERDKNGYVRPYSEAVSSDLFPTITGEIINAAVIAAYNAPNFIGDQLCTTINSKHEIENFVGFTMPDMPTQVLQGQEYEGTEIEEKYAQIKGIKVGMLIYVTMESVYFDQTGQLLDRCRLIGRNTALNREKTIVEGVQDIDSNIYKPSGVAEAFYSSSRTRNGTAAYNLSASSPFGETGLDNVTALVEAMVDEKGNPVLVDMTSAKVLFPQALRTQVLQMARSIKVPEGMENAANIYAGTFTPISSPYITRQSSTTWYYGTFVEDFIWMQIWPFMVSQANPGNMQEFTRDIKAIFKANYFGGFGARDFVHSYKCTA